MPSSATPDSILEHTCNRDIKIDANIIAYFGDYFRALRLGLSVSPNVTPATKQGFSVTPANYAHTTQSDTASAQNQS